MATTIPTLPVYTGDTPAIGQTQPTFNQNTSDKLAFDAQVYGVGGSGGGLNATIQAINTVSGEVEANAVIAEASATSAEQAAAALGYKGEWTPSTVVEIGGIYGYQGSEWRSLTGVSGVAPVDGNDWRNLDDHEKLTNRDSTGAHPASAISLANGGSVEDAFRSLIKTQLQYSVVDKMRSVGKPQYNYFKVESGELYCGSVFGGSPKKLPDEGTYLTGTEWRFVKNSDGLLLLAGGYSGDVSTSVEYQQDVVFDGAFTTNKPNRFATQIGDKFSGSISGANSMYFEHYADTRGGLFKVSVNNKEYFVSTYSGTAQLKRSFITDDLDPNYNYDYVFEFLGEDPLNTPSDTARGWVYYDVDNADIRPVIAVRFQGLTNKLELSASSSVNDFALLARSAGSSVPHAWVPIHSVSGVSKNVLTKVYVDGVLYSEGADMQTSQIASCETLSIQSRFTAVNPSENIDLWQHWITETVSDGVLSISNRLEFLTDTDISLGYLALLGARTDSISRVAFTNGQEIELPAPVSSTSFNATSGVMYAGTFDSSRGIYHGIGCDVSVYRACNVGNEHETQYANLQTVRSDNVAKTYWNAFGNAQVKAGQTFDSYANHYMLNGVRFPNVAIRCI